MSAERFVLDASVAVEWFLPGGGPRGRYAEGVLERISAGDLIPAVPDLWHYELASVLAQGAEPVGSTPEEFAAYIKSESVKWAKVVKESGAKAE
jgi:hypothetical protein